MQPQTVYQYLHGCVVTAYDYEVPVIRRIIELSCKAFSITTNEQRILLEALRKRADSISTVDNIHLLTQEMTQ